MYIYDFIQGLIIGGTLIIAIGPQNLFVIQQGLKKSYVFTVTLFCSLSDSLLIVIGIYLSNYIAVSYAAINNEPCPSILVCFFS